jgi:hypothetical protein
MGASWRLTGVSERGGIGVEVRERDRTDGSFTGSPSMSLGVLIRAFALTA